MNNFKKNWLFWLPRILGILFAAFVSIFVLDVFDGSGDWGKIFTALFISLIPTYILIIILLVAWRWELIGGILYIGLAYYYLFTVFKHLNLSVFMVIPFPCLVLGGLFLAKYIISRKSSLIPKPV